MADYSRNIAVLSRMEL